MITISNSELNQAIRLLKTYSTSQPRSMKEMESQRKAKCLCKKLEKRRNGNGD